MRRFALLAVLAILPSLLVGCPMQRVPSDNDDAEFEGDDPGECSDGADNDRDGFYDCDDPDCLGSPECGGDDDDATADDDDATADDDDATVDDDDTGPDDDDTTPEPEGAFIYAHTSTMLYEVDPDPPYGATPIGAFTGANVISQGITDIGVDLLGEMWGVGFFEVYEVDVTTAALTERNVDFAFAEMNAMTFLADGTLLAGAQNRLYEVDAATGGTTVIQTLTGYNFAGDMVGLPDGLLYMLMCVGTTPPCATSVVAMDLASGDFWEVGPTGQGDMYGVAYHNMNGLIYGFTVAGEVILIDPATGAGTVEATGGPEWWGATTNPARWSG